MNSFLNGFLSELKKEALTKSTILGAIAKRKATVMEASVMKPARIPVPPVHREIAAGTPEWAHLRKAVRAEGRVTPKPRALGRVAAGRQQAAKKPSAVLV